MFPVPVVYGFFQGTNNHIVDQYLAIPAVNKNQDQVIRTRSKGLRILLPSGYHTHLKFKQGRIKKNV